MSRTLRSSSISRQTSYLSPSQQIALRDWLMTQAQTYQLRWLLAHDLDGVIWGELRKDTLALSCDDAAFADGQCTLQWETLQQARLFSAAGELLLWYGPHVPESGASITGGSSEGWQARLFQDDPAASDAPDVGGRITLLDCIDESYLLWGTGAPEPARSGFRQYVEGAQGISHTPPLTQAPRGATRNRARLSVRHYLQEDADTGELAIGASRLMELLPPRGEETPHAP
jgi:CRISPR-associated protein (TIGR03984 family)